MKDIRLWIASAVSIVILLVLASMQPPRTDRARVSAVVSTATVASPTVRATRTQPTTTARSVPSATAQPTEQPTTERTIEPTTEPTIHPSPPTAEPTPEPTPEPPPPTAEPTPAILADRLTAAITAAIPPPDPDREPLLVETEGSLVIVTFPVRDGLAAVYTEVNMLRDMTTIVNTVYATDRAVERLSVIGMFPMKHQNGRVSNDLVGRAIITRAMFDASGGTIKGTDVFDIAEDPFVHPAFNQP